MTNSEDSMEYVGITKHTLEFRLDRHRHHAYMTNKLHTHMATIGPEKFSMELLESGYCASREERDILEQKWMDTLEPDKKLNTNRAHFSGSKSEYQRQSDAKYRNLHRDRVNQAARAYYHSDKNPLLTCKCGVQARKLSMRKHTRSNQHRRWLHKQGEDGEDEGPKETVDCGCGSMFQRVAVKRHNSSRRHQRWLRENGMGGEDLGIILSCECGSKIHKEGIRKHERTKRHTLWSQNNNVGVV